MIQWNSLEIRLLIGEPPFSMRISKQDNKHNGQRRFALISHKMSDIIVAYGGKATEFHKEILSNIPPVWGGWFSGFFDGEGCLIVRYKQTPYRCHLAAQISLRNDDIDVLLEIANTLKCGTVYDGIPPAIIKETYKYHLQSTWVVSNLVMINTVLVPLFNKYPLHSKKGKEFSIWREIAKIKFKTHRRKDIPKENLDRASELAKELLSFRGYSRSPSLRDAA